MKRIAFVLVFFIFGHALWPVVSHQVTAESPSRSSFVETADIEFEEDDDDEDVTESESSIVRTVRDLSNKKQPVIPTIQIRPAPPPATTPPYTSVERRLSCPPGYDLRGEECLTNDLVPPKVQCPAGHELQADGKCLAFARPRMDCPPEFRLSGGRCVAVEILPVQFTCPDGGDLDEPGLSCRVVQHVGPQCPPGYVFDKDNVCVQKFPAVRRCPENTVPHKHGCAKPVEFEAQTVCPPGSEMKITAGPNPTTSCHKVVHQIARCPKGYKMSPATGKCVKKVKKVLAPCNPGFVAVDGHSTICEKRLQIPPALSCPVEAKLDPVSGQCVSEIETPSTCPANFVKSRTVPEMCERIVEEVGTCPPDTTPVGSGTSMRCQTVHEQDSIECCPTGYDKIRNQCERREYIPPTVSCEECVRVRTVAATFACPTVAPDASEDSEGEFVLSGQRCIRRYTEPCDDTASTDSVVATTNCAVYQRLLSSVSLRSLSAVDPASFVPAECLRPNARAAQKMCQREQVIPAEPVCPFGAELSGTTCVERYEIPKEIKCPVGELDPVTQQCVKVTVVPLKLECPVGTTRTAGSRCVQYEQHAPQFNCPADSVMDRKTGSCVQRLPTIPEAPTTFRSAPIILCPSGAPSGDVCWDIERVPRHYVCPEGSVPDKSIGDQNEMVSPDGTLTIITTGFAEASHGSSHYCLMFADFILPPPTKKTVKPLYFCSDGTQTLGKKCTSHDYAPMTSVCPPGSTLDQRNTCTRRMKPISASPRVTAAVAVPVCPAGTVVQGTKCVSTKEVPPHIICPPGFVRSGLTGANRECAKEGDVLTFCPPGAVLTVDGCLVPKSTPALVTHVPVRECEATSSSDKCL